MRGGDLILHMMCTYKLDSGEYITSSGFAALSPTPSQVSDADIQKLYESAQAMCQTQASKIAQSLPQSVVFKHMVERRVQEIRERAKVEGKTDEQLRELEGPAKAYQQAKVTELCETIGITPIQLIGDNWQYSIMEALALTNELERVAVSLTKVANE